MKNPITETKVIRIKNLFIGTASDTHLAREAFRKATQILRNARMRHLNTKGE